MGILLALGLVLLTGLAPEGGPLLGYDSEMFAGDQCLAPSFEGAACAQQRELGGDEGSPTASAALLPPETDSGLDIDDAMLGPRDEVTYWCGEPECSPSRRILAAAG